MTVKCPVCEQRQLTPKRVLPNLMVLRCETCGLLISELVRLHHTGYRDIDDDAYEQSIAAVRREQASVIVAAVEDRGEWLDIGCGYGYVLDEARRAGFTVRGVEPDAKAAAAARARLGDVILAEDDDRPAKVISTLDVLEHIPAAELNAFAESVHRRADVWVIKVPSSEGLFFKVAHAMLPWSRSAVQRLWQSEHESPHTVYFSEASLIRFLAKHRFLIESVQYLDEIPSPTARERLRVDPTMKPWQVQLAVPVVRGINRLERWRRKSDALLLIARSHRR